MKLFRLMFLTAVLLISPTYALADTVVKDDFSSNTNLWQYLYDADRDAENRNIILTPNEADQRGGVWLKENVNLPIEISFKYKAGPETNPGDGFTFMFLKDKNYEAMGGAGLGFNDLDSSYNSSLGYAIEFDSYQNERDPSDRHIALIRNSTTNHLKFVNNNKVADNQWHNVDIELTESKVIVKIDGDEVLSWQGTLDTTYKGIGFSAATGGNTNLHLIDNVEIVSGTDLHQTVISANIKDGDTLKRASTFHLNVTASDEDGVESLVTYLDGNRIANNANIDLTALTLGKHLLEVNCIDKEGNETEKIITFYVKDNAEVAQPMKDLRTLLAKGYAAGHIKNKGIYNSLLQKLVKGNLNAFINQLRAQKGKHVSQRLAVVLINKASLQITKKNPVNYENCKTKILKEEKDQKGFKKAKAFKKIEEVKHFKKVTKVKNNKK